MNRAARSLRRACQQGQDLQAREDMALASLFGGLSLADAGIRVIRWIRRSDWRDASRPARSSLCRPATSRDGGQLPCAGRTPERQCGSATLRHGSGDLDRLRESHSTGWDLLDKGIMRGAAMCGRRPEYGVTETDIESLVDKAAEAGRTKANPIALTKAELTTILQAAL